jgi:hypothetical protein
MKGDSCEDREICLECGDRNAGEPPRDEGEGDNVGLPSNLRSNGCKAPEADLDGNRRGVEGRPRPGVDGWEPNADNVSSGIDPESSGLARGDLANGVTGSGGRSRGVSSGVIGLSYSSCGISSSRSIGGAASS